jgi:hypothetical protein
MKTPTKLDFAGVLRRHAQLLEAGREVPRADTAGLLRKAAKALEVMRAIAWGVEPCAKS